MLLVACVGGGWKHHLPWRIYAAVTIGGCCCLVAAAVMMRHPILGVSACLFGMIMLWKNA